MQRWETKLDRIKYCINSTNIPTLFFSKNIRLKLSLASTVEFGGSKMLLKNANFTSLAAGQNMNYAGRLYINSMLRWYLSDGIGEIASFYWTMSKKFRHAPCLWFRRIVRSWNAFMKMTSNGTICRDNFCHCFFNLPM